MSAEKDLLADAKNFCDGLGNVFMMKRRDPQSHHLLQKAKTLIEALTSEKKRTATPPVAAPRGSRGGGGMGQLWVKLDELKRENEELRKHTGRHSDDKSSSHAKHQGPGEVIIADLHKTRTENENLKSQLQKTQTAVKELEMVNCSLQDEFKRTKLSYDMAQQTLEKIRKEQRTLETSLNSVKTENDTLKKRLTNSVKPIMRTDNRHVENINERCRPSNIAILYNNLESQEWVDAKESLEDAGFDDEETVTRFLAAVVMSSYEASGLLLEAVESTVMELMKKPTMAVSSTSRDGASRLVASEDLRLSMKELLRQNVDGVDVAELATITREQMLREPTWRESSSLLQDKSVALYMEECSRVTWQMVIQHPPMCLATKDKRFSEEVHKLWWSCDQSKAAKIDFFIWPSLYDYENGNLMVKGCVYAS